MLKTINDDTKCAPHKKFEDSSCFTFKELQKIANNYNKRHKHKINLNQSKKDLVKDLTSALSTTCNNQICWLRLNFIKDLRDENILKNTFRPRGPRKYKWLSTLHINNVLYQYQYKYPEFLFLGTVPYDFEDLPGLGLKNINFDKLLKKNKYKFGLVINLDEHYKSGSHWVSLYFDLKAYQIYFFDSVAKPPQKRIRIFIKKIMLYIIQKKTGKDLILSDINDLIKYHKSINNVINITKLLDFKYNTVQHQYKNSECGVYSIYFILKLLEGNSFKSITTNVVRDDDMAKCRDKYFILE